MKLKEITFGGNTWKNVEVRLEEYVMGGTALCLYDSNGLIATATIYIDEPLGEGCLWIKTYSENAGLDHALVDAGVLEFTGRLSSSGMGSEAKLLTHPHVVTLASDRFALDVNVLAPNGTSEEQLIDMAHDLARDEFCPRGDDGQGPFFSSIHTEMVKP